jgi:D-3-phosphoglycerate dehydrogenase / 2-oxoglutarate reductase
MKSPRILVINNMHRSIKPLMKEIGWNVDYKPTIRREEILNIIGNYEGLITRSKTMVDKELLDRAPRLRFVGRAGAGLDQIDQGELARRDIILLNAPEGNRDALGEHTVGMLLTLLHKINQAHMQVKAGRWEREVNRGMELRGKTVGIYGFGNMGSAFAEKLAGFGCKVLAYDRSKKEISLPYVKQVSLEEFESEVEILSLHVPLTNLTKGLFNAENLGRYDNLKIILNTARGEILDLKVVLDLLEKGLLKGAGLDVLENEKLGTLTTEQKERFDALVTRPDVVVTPHVAGWSHESYERINRVLADKMVKAGLAVQVAHRSKN